MCIVAKGPGEANPDNLRRSPRSHWHLHSCQYYCSVQAAISAMVVVTSRGCATAPANLCAKMRRTGLKFPYLRSGLQVLPFLSHWQVSRTRLSPGPVPLPPRPAPFPFRHGIRCRSHKVSLIPWKRPNRHPSQHQHPSQQGCFPVHLSPPAMLCFTLTSPASLRFCPLFRILFPHGFFP